MADKKLVLFIHGWSVRSTDTYGRFPERLQQEAQGRDELDIDVRQIWLGKYISFRDEVRVEDISRAFEAAIRREIGTELAKGRRFAAITHSTGGPVVRDWWHRFYLSVPGQASKCPMSHLIMLAPANFGSSLAQLGKSTVSRLKTWFEGVEPGKGVLDWLELGSRESLQLNQAWIKEGARWMKESATFPFVLTGQSIDRSLYDHVNSYTGELGSDGVVRVASANLNATYVRLEQDAPRQAVDDKKKVLRDDEGRPIWVAPDMHLAAAGGQTATTPYVAPRTAMVVLRGLAHSGTDKGILRSVNLTNDRESVDAVIECLLVNDDEGYAKQCDRFDAWTEKTQRAELIEREKHLLLPDTCYVHDRFTQVIVRVCDERDYALEDFDFLLTGGKNDDPDMLPQGFFQDRQRNGRNRNTVTYYLNYDVMQGSPAVKSGTRTLRAESKGPKDKRLGFRVQPRPTKGFVHYLDANFAASTEALRGFLQPNATLILDLVLKRVVHDGVFGFERVGPNRTPVDFTNQPPGEPLSG